MSYWWCEQKRAACLSDPVHSTIVKQLLLRPALLQCSLQTLIHSACIACMPDAVLHHTHLAIAGICTCHPNQFFNTSLQVGGCWQVLDRLFRYRVSSSTRYIIPCTGTKFRHEWPHHAQLCFDSLLHRFLAHTSRSPVAPT